MRVKARVLLPLLAVVLHVLLRVTPRRPHAFVTGWPADEGNLVETVTALIRRYPGDIVWADAPTPSRLEQLEIDRARVITVRKRSVKSVCAFLTAEVTLVTHGVYGCPRPVPGKPIVNLWHGDGPKATTGTRVHSSYLVTGSAVLARTRAEHFGVRPGDVLVTGLPRVEQLRRPSSPGQLTALGIDPDRPFAVWLPTYRTGRGTGRDGVLHDTPDEEADADVRDLIAPGLDALRRLGIQVVVHPHPLDGVTRAAAADLLVTDRLIARAGTTLYHLLGASAGLLTDYSSVWTDYLALDRPIGFFLPDLDAYLAGRGLDPADSMDHLPGPHLRTAADFTRIGTEMLGDGDGCGRALRRASTAYFQLVHPLSPADALLDALLERGAIAASA